MFDIGWPELIMVAIVMILVVGPKDLPPMLRAFGRTIKKYRSMARDFQNQFNEALEESELDELRQTVDEAKKFNPANQINEALKDAQPVKPWTPKPEEISDAARAVGEAKPDGEGRAAKKAPAKRKPATAKKAATKSTAAKSTSTSAKIASGAAAKSASAKKTTAAKATAQKTVSEKAPAKTTARPAAKKPAGGTKAAASTAKPSARKPRASTTTRKKTAPTVTKATSKTDNS